MRSVVLPKIGTWEAFRDAARGLLAAGLPPEEVLWHHGEVGADLFAEGAPPPTAAPVTVPRTYVDLVRKVIWHRDPERFARAYGLLWALQGNRTLLRDRGDARVDRLERMAKEVSRDRHKMTAFLRFREIGAKDAPRRSFAAWFEPSHFILEPVSPFFTNRFGDMDWAIFTPDLSARFEGGTLSLHPPEPRPDLPQDGAEDLWRTYFRNIFNPARLKPQAMQSEMPRKYWKNLPEASLIPGLIAGAQAHAQAMAEAAPTLPPRRAAPITTRLQKARADVPLPEADSPEALAAELAACRRCPLWCNATQAVAGEGPREARLMIVGEQPGDQEDLAGRPFVGPAGQLFDKVSARAGLGREQAWVTNAVKHFKFTPRGKRRLHQRPNGGEISHCRWWLEREIDLVKPDLIVAMGATALESLTGDGRAVASRRGRVEQTYSGILVVVTTHPSYLLRLPQEARPDAEQLFESDLATAAALLRGEGALPPPAVGGLPRDI
ncbi:uracil-DNA glycosylase [Salipiger pallidus]|uniref:Type-4 uracil-DNA glycosylase n=1 Tax=Salipiger pallidus TaxID=1775170 RepID=A0A8J2ZHF8_9RHOB|nr:UdgX family uracil-DNA binding protein [Salipiger pallidus]GGG64075.1 uracil-DNA glycosylase [Salipiger pallidus]